MEPPGSLRTASGYVINTRPGPEFTTASTDTPWQTGQYFHICQWEIVLSFVFCLTSTQARDFVPLSKCSWAWIGLHDDTALKTKKLHEDLYSLCFDIVHIKLLYSANTASIRSQLSKARKRIIMSQHKGPSYVQRQRLYMYNVKKSWAVFLSPAGMSLTKLSLAKILLNFSGHGEFGKWYPGWDGKIDTFFQCNEKVRGVRKVANVR